MADDPVRHEPAVASARLAYALFIYLGVLLQYRVREIHQVSVIRAAVIAEDVRKFIVSSVAALRIAEKHEISFSRPDLHLMVKHRAVYRLRAAVDVENGGVSLLRVIILLQKHPAADLKLPASYGQRLGLCDISSFCCFFIE